MDSDVQRLLIWVIQVIGGAFGTVLWLNFRDLKLKCETTAKELGNYKIHIAEQYVTQTELTKAIDTFNRSIDAVFAKLDRIEDKLDGKADKL